MNKKVFIPAMAAIFASLALTATVQAAGGNIVMTTRVGQPSVQDMVIEPGADPSELQLHFAGAERVTRNASGNLDIVKKDGSMWHYKPEVYQVVNGKRKPVVAGFRILDKDRVSLRVDHADPSAAIVIGPFSKM
jgi:hypothetical protein